MDARRSTRWVAPAVVIGSLAFSVLAGAQRPGVEERLGGQFMNLEAGKIYLIKVTKPMVLPAGMQLVPLGSTNQGFYHNGERRDRPGTQCSGDITQLLDDKGAVGYRCERCKKEWEPRGK
jgi:hypothetical protein